jgi:hypothetical protein
MEITEAPQWSTLVTRRTGDAMYLILEGELRARLVAGAEYILATLGPGDFFGEISLFDHGPRSADIIANQDSFLLKISTAGVKHSRAKHRTLPRCFCSASSKPSPRAFAPTTAAGSIGDFRPRGGHLNARALGRPADSWRARLWLG